MTEKIEEKMLGDFELLLEKASEAWDEYALSNILDASMSFRGVAAQILSIIKEHCVIPVEGELSVWEKNTWFWRNCCQQRKKPAKICLECPFIDYQTGKLKAGYRKVREIEI